VGVDPAANTRDLPAKNTRNFAVKHGAGYAILVLGHGRVVADIGLLGEFPINMVKYK
jgi:hypothetical protein